MGKKKKVDMPSLDDTFIHIKDLKVGQKVYFSQTREPLTVVSKKIIAVPVVELKDSRGITKLTGNQFMSKEIVMGKMGSEGGGFYGKNGGFE